MSSAQPSPASLSSFLGGWARQSQSPETTPGTTPAAPQEEAQEASSPGAGQPVEAAPQASPALSAAQGPARGDGHLDGDGGGEPVATGSGPGAAALPAPQPDECTEPDEHIIEPADPRDFADDAGPQYEDEDFDEINEAPAPSTPRTGPAGPGAPTSALSAPSGGQAGAHTGGAGGSGAPAAPADPAEGGDGGSPGSPAPGRAETSAAAVAAGGAGTAPVSTTAPATTAGASSSGAAGLAVGAGPAAPAGEGSPQAPDPEKGLPDLESFEDRFADRELTWMDFNERVLEQAEDRSLPLLERAWFLSIFSSNLDEFYMVRVAGLMRRIKAGITPVRASGLNAHQVLSRVTARAKELTARQAAVFQQDVRPALAEHGIEILTWDQLAPEQQERLTRYFRHQIFPVLTPLAVDPSHPFPYISGLSLNLAVILRNPRSGKEHFARIKVPGSLPRLITVPGRELNTADTRAGCAVIPIEVVIGQHLDHLFPGMDILEHHLFRVTRNENLEVEEDDAENLLKAMEKELERRRFGDSVRLEVEDTISSFTRRYLVRALRLRDDDVFELPAPLDLNGLTELHDLDIPALKYPRFVPVTARGLATRESSSAPDVFAAMREHDILLHHPYDSFSTSVQEFVAQAAADPKVLAIKQTLYRTSGDSPIVDALIEAAEAGKQVVAIVEIKARFDEEANISWARKLERAGVHVVYGMVGLKTHCKLLLVVRQESDGLRRYCHVGTGNYHPKTARGYEDLGLLTCDRDVAQDLTTLFNQLSGYAPRARFRRLLVAPRSLRDGLVERIEREVDNHRAGLPAWIRIKVNSIVDETVINALYRASRAGVPVDIVVRGICGIRAGVPGLSDNIRVHSILGRFLEHSRIYAFAAGGETELYIGSADLMHRNLDRRVEALVRITDPAMVAELEELVTHCASDEVASWHLQPNDTWTRHAHGPDGERLEDIQDSLMARARSRVKGRS